MTADRAPARPLAFGWKTGLALPLAALVVARTLAGFAAIIRDHLAIDYDLSFELGMVVGQVLFQWAVLWRRSWTDRRHYAVIHVLVSSLGAGQLRQLLRWPHRAPNPTGAACSVRERRWPVVRAAGRICNSRCRPELQSDDRRFCSRQ